MISNALRPPSWYGSTHWNESNNISSKVLLFDKVLSIRTPSLSTEMDRNEDLLKPTAAMATNTKRDYYHELYKKALKCIDSTAAVPPPPPVTSPKSFMCPSPPDMRTPPPVTLPPPSQLPPPVSGGYDSVGKGRGYELSRDFYPYMEGGEEVGEDCIYGTGGCWMGGGGNPCAACQRQKMNQQHVQRDIMMNEKAFFTTEFLIRQKEKWRRPRTVYTEKQLVSLEKSYKTNKYLRGKERKELCKQLNLEERHIKVWYQNRRAKERGQIRHDKWLKKAGKYSKKIPGQ